MNGGLHNPRPVDDTPVNGQLVHGVTSNRMFDHEADLDAHTRNMWEVMRTGEYIGLVNANATPSMVANRLYATPLLVVRNITIDRIAIQVTTLAGGASARLGIFNNGANLYPGSLLLDAGTVSVATTGIKAITINQALTKGLYWFAVVSDGVPQLYAGNPPRPSILGLGSALFVYSNVGWYVAHTFGTLPDPFTGGATLGNGSNGYPSAFMVVPRLLSLD